jgi:hypothetical protein
MARAIAGRFASVCTQSVVFPLPDGAEMTTNIGLDAEDARAVPGVVMFGSETKSQIANRKS